MSFFFIKSNRFLRLLFNMLIMHKLIQIVNKFVCLLQTRNVLKGNEEDSLVSVSGTKH